MNPFQTKQALACLADNVDVASKGIRSSQFFLPQSCPYSTFLDGMCAEAKLIYALEHEGLSEVHLDCCQALRADIQHDRMKAVIRYIAACADGQFYRG